MGVRVLLCRSSNAEAIEDLPVEVFSGDVQDPASLPVPPLARSADLTA